MSIPEKAMEYARSKLGLEYSQPDRWDDVKFDCSSLVYRAFRAAGYTFVSGSTSDSEVYDLAFDLLWPHDRDVLGKQFTSIAKLKRSGYEPQPGDVIYINTTPSTKRKNKITHVVMVEDENHIVHARGVKFGVRRDDINTYDGKIVAVTRFSDGTKHPRIATTKVASAVCSGQDVNVRSGQGAEHKAIAMLGRNYPIIVIEDGSQWPEISTILPDGRAINGYMHYRYIDVIKEG